MNTPNEPKPLGAEEIEKLLARFEPGWKSFMKFVDHFFGNKGAKPWVSIPAREDNDDLFVTALLRDAESTIRTLTAENATLLKQRDMMSHLLNGGTFTPEEIVAAGLGMCTLEDRAHAVFRLKQENATLRAERDEAKRGMIRIDEAHDESEERNKALQAERDQLKARVEELDGAMRHAVLHKVPDITAQLAAANRQNAELVKALEVYAKEENWTNTVGGGRGEDDYEIEMYRAMKWQRDEEDGWALAKAALAQAGGPLCVNCGIGFILPSGVCDHCDTKQAGGKVNT